ncbi:MAG TPA: PadR family transcriptional regulator [Solirubrobacteraceae bacterium]|nr:PadR family transcriptional regulator [Solirubrobacteraceae bacterium]
MFAQAIYEIDPGRCGRRGEPYGLRALWRALAAEETDHEGDSRAGRGRHGGHHRHHHGPGHRGGGFGFGGPPGGGPFGGGAFGGGPLGRGRKARRGDARTAALLLLAEEPRNGYQIMQELKERSDGAWSPSPGSVYPALQQLEDEGLIRSEEIDGRKLFRLTDDGRKHVEQRPEGTPAPWEAMAGGVSDQASQAGSTIREVGFAVMQVMRTGSEAQIAQAAKVLTDTRRALYKILADGDPGTVADGSPSTTEPDSDRQQDDEESAG